MYDDWPPDGHFLIRHQTRSSRDEAQYRAMSYFEEEMMHLRGVNGDILLKGQLQLIYLSPENRILFIDVQFCMRCPILLVN